jgi:hypothetical protein
MRVGSDLIRSSITNEALKNIALQMHASIVLAHDIMNYASLYLEIADTYFEKDLYTDARPVYEALGTDSSVREACSESMSILNFIDRRAACTFFSKQQHVVEP